jgi:AraC-like DNA-binding protein
MASRLERIEDWEGLAEAARYRVEVLAELAGISRRTLGSFFSEHFGQSPRAWLNTLRCKEVERLRGLGVSRKAISIQLGYAHPGNFSRAFPGLST